MKDSIIVTPKIKQPAHRRIYEGLRSQIAAGKLPLGTQLPSTRTLAAQWETNMFTVHTALTSLTREGWLHRRRGSGTFIADPATRFSCAGIYQDAEIGVDPQMHFQRFVQFSLIRRLEKMKKGVEVFLDSRPQHNQDVMLPSMEDAIRQRRIQCVIAPHLNAHNSRFISRLTLPLVIGAHSTDPRRVGYDNSTFFQESVQRLKAKGCRTVGLLTNVERTDKEGPRAYFRAFEAAMEEAGMRSRDAWVSNVGGWVEDLERHGYNEFRRLWHLRSRPDGIIVYPDLMIRGLIPAIFEAGKADVVERIKFVFHRNAHIPIFCPVPAIWATSREDLMVEAMIEIIQKQFRREIVTPTMIPFTFSEEAAGWR